LNRLTSESEPMRKSLMAHELMIHAHSQQITACNAAHGLEERLCRWLLQTRDLLASDTLPLTQEFLAQMLGVQRSSLTMIARKLQEIRTYKVSARAYRDPRPESRRIPRANATRPSTAISSGWSAWHPARP
jgi:CRP-like cAMP-binding protein